MERSLARNAIRDPVLTLADVADVAEPAERLVLADDPHRTQATQRLAQVLEDPVAAEGIAAALQTR